MAFRRSIPSARWCVLGLAVLLVALEGGLRYAGYGRLPAIEGDPVLGFKKIPDQDKPGRFGEGIRINAHGLRDRDWAEPADGERGVHAGGRDGLRIALLGDSVSYAAGVPVDAGLARRIESGLAEAHAAHGASEVLVMNFSQPGYVLEQQIRSYAALARPWRPDVVVLCVGSASIRPMLPVLETRTYPLRNVIVGSAIWDYTERRLLRAGASAGLARDMGAQHEAVEAALSDKQAVLGEPDGERADELRALAGARLEALAATVRADGGRLWILLVPRNDELRRDAGRALSARWAAVAAALPDVHLVDCVEPMRRVLEPLMDEARAAGLEPREVWARRPVVGAEALLRDPRNPYLAADATHLSPSGHALVAQAFLDRFLAAHSEPGAQAR